MKLTNETYQAILGMQNYATTDASPQVQAGLVAKASEVLEILHSIDSIERINNLAGAIALIERSAKNVIRVFKAPTPKYLPHPVTVDAFLAIDFKQQESFATGKLPTASDSDLAKLFD